jgi:glycosyltransferase involved in cell wall biosynthesis
MKILHIAYIYPPDADVADGITSVVYNQTKELSRRGHEVSVYTSNMLDLHSNRSLTPGHKLINGVNVYYLNSLWHSNTLIFTPHIIPLLSKNLFSFDIVHIHDCRSFQGITTYLFSKLKHVPYVFQPHGSYLSKSYSSLHKQIAKVPLDNIVSDRIFKGASKVIALTETEANEYRRAGLPSNRITVIPNGIDLSDYSELPPKGYFKSKFMIKQNSKIMLYLGRVNKTKGLELLIKAFSCLIKNMFNGNVQLVIAGPDDGYLAEAKSLVSSLEISSSVLFTGFLSRKEKLAALVDADVFVTPSFSGFPITFLEACYAGTPIITTTLGDNMPWIDNNVGYVTKPTSNALAERAHAMLSSVELESKFSKNCKNIVQSTFSVEKVVDQLEKLYREII